jgi:hypothetical protein
MRGRASKLMEISTIPKLSEHAPRRYVSSSPKDDGGDYMAAGSENVMLTGSGKTQVFKGVTPLLPKLGGIVMMNVAEDFASLGQESDVTAYGNVFNVFSALFYIGKGLLRLAGISLLVNASATLSLLVKRNGSYTDPLSGPWQAGLAQPSAPTIQAVAPPAGFTGKVNGIVSVVLWRIRSTTGAVSIHSEPSNILSAANQSVGVAVPLPDANGQDYWGIGVTLNNEGQTGSHFELIEVPESQVAESIARTDVTTDSTQLDITSATAGVYVESYRMDGRTFRRSAGMQLIDLCDGGSGRKQTNTGSNAADDINGCPHDAFTRRRRNGPERCRRMA